MYFLNIKKKKSHDPKHFNSKAQNLQINQVKINSSLKLFVLMKKMMVEAAFYSLIMWHYTSVFLQCRQTGMALHSTNKNRMNLSKL